MPDFEALLDSIAKRPGMYVGHSSIRAVSHYLAGFDHALSDVGLSERPLDGWIRWIESRFLISSPAWHWTRILLHVYGSDQAAIEALPVLYSEFLARRSSIGIEGIEAERKLRLTDEDGFDFREPASTHTIIGWL